MLLCSTLAAIGGCRRAVLLVGETGRSGFRSLRSSFLPHAPLRLRLRVALAEVDVEVEVEHLRRAAAA